MRKLVPFKYKFGHVTIKEFINETTTSIIKCETCIDNLLNGKFTIRLENSRHTINSVDLLAYRI